MWEYLLELSVALQDVLVSRVLQDDAISLESTITPLGSPYIRCDNREVSLKDLYIVSMKEIL